MAEAATDQDVTKPPRPDSERLSFAEIKKETARLLKEFRSALASTPEYLEALNKEVFNGTLGRDKYGNRPEAYRIGFNIGERPFSVELDTTRGQQGTLDIKDHSLVVSAPDPRTGNRLSVQLHWFDAENMRAEVKEEQYRRFEFYETDTNNRLISDYDGRSSTYGALRRANKVLSILKSSPRP